jgi:hypothetical protein
MADGTSAPCPEGRGLRAAYRMKPDPLEHSDLPKGLSQPARRALDRAGYHRLEQLTGVTEAELKQLHGVGPKALEQLRRALGVQDLSFATD